MISIKMNLKRLKADILKCTFQAYLILAEQYTNSVFNSKVLVRITTQKSQNYKQLFIVAIVIHHNVLGPWWL